MTNDQLADLLEEAARRLRIADGAIQCHRLRRSGFTTAQLSEKTGVPAYTIRKYAEALGALPVGGQHGFEFPKKAVEQLPILIRARAEKRKKARGA